jgi:hypothetical protein
MYMKYFNYTRKVNFYTNNNAAQRSNGNINEELSNQF